MYRTFTGENLLRHYILTTLRQSSYTNNVAYNVFLYPTPSAADAQCHVHLDLLVVSLAVHLATWGGSEVIKCAYTFLLQWNRPIGSLGWLTGGASGVCNSVGELRCEL